LRRRHDGNDRRQCADLHADAHADRDVDADSDSDVQQDADSHDTYVDSDDDGESHTHSQRNGFAYSYPLTHADGDPRRADADTHSPSDLHADPSASHSDADRRSHAPLSPLSDRGAVPQADLIRQEAGSGSDRRPCRSAWRSRILESLSDRKSNRTSRAPGIALAVLTLVNLFNYLDRFVVSALAESLKTPPLSLSDTQLGSLFTGFIVVYMLTSPVFGRLGDRGARPRLLAIGVAIWSVATALGGFARNFAALFVARATVGVGEAAYGTIAPALLADSFSRKKRGRVFAIFFSAIPIGSAAGYVLGGAVDQRFGWRAAFFVAGVPGLLLALACLGLKDPPRGGQDEEEDSRLLSHPVPLPRKEGSSIWATYRRLLRNRPYALTVAGYAAYTFALGGLAFWMPSFLERVRGLSKTEATTQFGAIVVITGFAGTFAGGWLGDWYLKRSANAYLQVSGWATLAAAPAALAAFVLPQKAAYMAAIVVAELLLFASTGLINSAIVNVVAPTERATAVALSILVIHLLGDVPSPFLIGVISDATSLATAFRIVPVAILAGGLIWLWAARSHGLGSRAAV